jgi:hypothetical protein
LIVAAAATSTLTLCGSWAFADSGPSVPGADSFASAGNTDAWDFPGGASALRAIERAEGATQMARRMTGEFSAPAHTTDDSPSRVYSTHRTESSHGFSSVGHRDDDSGNGPSRGGHGDDDPGNGPSQGGHGDDDSGNGPSQGSYGDDGPNQQPSQGSYGDDGPNQQPSQGSYGDEEPTPTPPEPPQHQETPPPAQHQETPPPAHEPPEMAHTGTDGTLPALAASGALLAAGTALYRRGRRGTSPK